MGSLNSYVIHFLAKCASPQIISFALKLYPDWISLRDSEDNTLLHYASQNSNEKAFVDLVQRDNSIFSMNVHGETPLGLLVYRLQQADPLAWNRNDVIIFLANWLPTALLAIDSSGVLPTSSQFIMALFNTGMQAYSIRSWLNILMENLSTPKKILFMLALFGTSWVPIINIPFQAYSTYCLVSRAYQGLKTAWDHLYHRPLKALSYATVHASNATSSLSSLYETGKLGWITYKVASFTQSFFSKFPSFTTSAQTCKTDHAEDKDAYASCWIEQAEHIFYDELNELKQFPQFENLYDSVLRPFISENAAYCLTESNPNQQLDCTIKLAEKFFSDWKRGNAGPYGNAGTLTEPLDCKNYKPLPDLTVSLIDRLEQVDRPDCLRGALDIFGLSNGVPNKGLYRDLSLQVHPDKVCQIKHCTDTDKAHYNDLFKKIIAAATTVGITNKKKN